MKLAIVEHHLQVPEAELFTTARQLGLDGVELSFGAFGAEERTLWQPEGPAFLRQLAADSGIVIPSLYAGYFPRHDLADPRPEVQQAQAAVLGRLIDACAEAGIPVLRYPAHGIPPLRRGSPARRMLDGLRPLVERAGIQNVRIALETLLPAEELRDVIAQFGCPHVTACYDVGNARAAGRDVVAEIKLLADCLGQVQIKDRDRREPFPSVPLGAGMVDWRAALDALREIRFAHWLVLDTPSGDQPLESASKNLQFLRALLRNTHAAADPPDHRQGTMND